MPALRSQALDATGLTLVASDGRSITLTKAQVVGHFQSEVGTVQQRVVATIAWLRLQIVTALGAEQIALNTLGVDFDGVGFSRFSFGDGAPPP